MRHIKYSLFLIIFAFTSCAPNNTNNNYTRYSFFSFDVFDTFTSILGYTQNQEDFNYFSGVMYAELQRLHMLFDKFNEYPNVNNIATINKNAGIKPVVVDIEIINMINEGIAAYHLTNGIINIAIGPVTNIWRSYINAGEEVLPGYEALKNASVYTNISGIIVDEINQTVFLNNENMALDVGSIAKGFAIEHVAQKAQAIGLTSFSLSMGGDVRLGGAPKGERPLWNVGVLNPHEQGDFVDVISGADIAIFSSGNYMRYYRVDGVKMHHIIDPRTLKPSTTAASVTVKHPCGIMAENLSLAAFILDIDQGKELLERFDASALWVLECGTVISH